MAAPGCGRPGGADLGAITAIPRKLGRGSGLKINDVFWTTFLGNSDFFKAASKNYISGADTALTIDGLTKASVTFDEQVDSDGRPIGVMPAILLVPTALSAMACPPGQIAPGVEPARSSGFGRPFDRHLKARTGAGSQSAPGWLRK